MNPFVQFISTHKPTTPLPLEGIKLIEKIDWILAKVAGKSVLHLGPTDSPETSTNAKIARLLHQKLQGKCRELVGLDLDASCIEILKRDYGISDIIHGDAERLGDYFPERKFDFVIAGDIIEHVNNFGLLLDGVRNVLEPDGKFIVTTPNALAIKRVLGAIVLGQERNNPDHMYFFSPMNLWQAATRFGFQITEMCSFMYVAPGNKTNARGNMGAQLVIRITGNAALADELAAVLEPIK